MTTETLITIMKEDVAHVESMLKSSLQMEKDCKTNGDIKRSYYYAGISVAQELRLSDLKRLVELTETIGL